MEKYDVEIMCRDFCIFFFIYFIGIHWKGDDLLSHCVRVFFRFTAYMNGFFMNRFIVNEFYGQKPYFRYHSELYLTKTEIL